MSEPGKHGVIPDVEVLRCPYDDSDTVISAIKAHLIVMTAKVVALHLQAGRTVLVTCVAGINRSSLVVALALQLYEGLEPWLAVERIRAKRSVHCLSNVCFERAALRRNALFDELMRDQKIGTPVGTMSSSQ